MASERIHTITGSKLSKITFSPEFSGFSVQAAPVAEAIGRAADLALQLERTTAELAEVHARLKEVESKLENTKVPTSPDSVKAEQPLELPDNRPIDNTRQIIDVRGAGIITLSKAGDKPQRERRDADFEEPAAVVTEEPVTLGVPQPATFPPASEAKPSYQEIRRRSQLSQAEVIREIVTHENFTPSGHLEAHNVSAIIKQRVQARTGMSDEQWRNAYTNLRGKKIIALRTYPDNPKMSHTVIIDREIIARAIEKGELFILEEDEAFKENFLKSLSEETEQREREGASPVEPDPEAEIIAVKAVQATTEPPVIISPAPQAPKPVVPLPKSGRLRRQEERDRREREERAAGCQVRGKPERRNFAESVLGSDGEVLPDYDKVSKEEWEAMPDETRFLLALTHGSVTQGDFKSNAELLEAIIIAGKISPNDSQQRQVPMKVPTIIKGLKSGSQPKIYFTNNKGNMSLELTEAGREYLVTQFRKIQLAVIRAREAQANAQRPSRAA